MRLRLTKYEVLFKNHLRLDSIGSKKNVFYIHFYSHQYESFKNNSEAENFKFGEHHKHTYKHDTLSSPLLNMIPIQLV